jgi:ribosomal protein S27E
MLKGDLVKTKCSRCEGKGWFFWSLIDRMLNIKTNCERCNHTGIIFRYAPIVGDLH